MRMVLRKLAPNKCYVDCVYVFTICVLRYSHYVLIDMYVLENNVEIVAEDFCSELNL